MYLPPTGRERPQAPCKRATMCNMALSESQGRYRSSVWDELEKGELKHLI